VTSLAAPAPGENAVRERPPLVLERRHVLAALAILAVLFAPYQTLVQTVITDDAVRKGIEADDYDMVWVTVAYGVGVLYGVFVGLGLSFRIGRRYTLVLGMLVFSAGNILCGAASGLVSMAFGRFVEGFGKMLDPAHHTARQCLPRCVHVVALDVLGVRAGRADRSSLGLAFHRPRSTAETAAPSH
jgi:MFS family permease